MIITREVLKRLGACESGISFFERNFPSSADTDEIEVVGDYYGFYRWLRQRVDGVYDSRGNLVKYVNECGLSCKMKYDARNNMTKKACPGSSSSVMKYDSQNRKIMERDSDGFKVTFKYKGSHCIREIHSTGRTKDYEYDDRGNNIKVVDSTNGVTCMAYDCHGNMINKFSDSGMLVTYEYNDQGQLLKAFYSDEGKEWTWEYDQIGNVIKLVYPWGQIQKWSYLYDPQGHLISIECKGSPVLTIKYL